MNSQITKTYISKSVADKTRRTYMSVRNAFNRWLGEHKLARSDLSLATYLAEIQHASENRAQARCELTVAAERWFAKHRNQKSIVGRTTHYVLCGIRRCATERRGQVTGLLWEEVDRVVDVQLKSYTLRGLRNAALIGLGSDCLLRPCEIQAIQVEDLTFNFKHDGSTLWIPVSKTDQLGTGKAMYVGTPTAMVVYAWMRAGGVQNGKLFRRITSHDRVIGLGLSVNSVRTIIQQSIKAAGFKGYYGGQSLRVGAAQSLALANATLPQIMEVGRWESVKMVIRYTRKNLPCYTAVATLRYNQKFPRLPRT